MDRLGEGPITREQLDAHVAALIGRLRGAGRAVGQEVLRGRQPAPMTATEAAEASLVSMSLDAEARAELILMLDRDGRLADCDRDALVAEADFILSGDPPG